MIQLRTVNKEFKTKKGTVHALKNIDFQVKQGDIYGLIGYSGAGKSTLIRLLNGLELPTTGEVIINNQVINELGKNDLKAFRKKVGMIFQHFNLLWSRTVLENIQLPLELSHKNKEEREAKAKKLIELVGLTGKENAYPSELSGGQKQRVGIARALANDPEILLCDEATSALDPQTTDEVLELLKQVNEELGITIVMITHEMHVIRKICHHVAVMEAGQIVESGSVLDVFSQPKDVVTKRFVQKETLPGISLDKENLQELAQSFKDGKLVQLTFTGDKSQQPLISQVIKHHDVILNVIQGQIQAVHEGSVGTLIVEMVGPDEAVVSALEFLNEQGVKVEVANDENE